MKNYKSVACTFFVNVNIALNLFLLRKLEFYTGVRSSHQSCYMEIGVLRNFAKFIGKHLCQGLFFNKVAGGGLQFY